MMLLTLGPIPPGGPGKPGDPSLPYKNTGK